MSSRPAYRLGVAALAFALGCESPMPTTPPEASVPEPSLTPTEATFVANAPPIAFGRYRGIEYLRFTGRFEGATTMGAFRVPYEIIAPASPHRGSRTLLIEPPHFAQGPAARDDYLGRDFLLGHGLRYASVGWATFQHNILDPEATDVFIAGGAGGFDDEIVVQFTLALTSDPYTTTLLGDIERRYGYGYSQTSALLHRVLRSPTGRGLFDFTMLNATWWAGFGFSGTFTPPSGAGKIIVVQSEGDVVVSDAEAFRVDPAHSHFRSYEVAGGAHIPDVPGLADSDIGPLLQGTNPVAWPAVARAMFRAGDRWIREGIAPPPSVYLGTAPGVDPVYGFPTGVARDAALNALGGVRLPNVVLGTSQFIAADFGAPIAPLMGSSVDRTCDGGTPLFTSHGSYVEAFSELASDLVRTGYLLRQDASGMTSSGAKSDVGKPYACAA